MTKLFPEEDILYRRRNLYRRTPNNYSVDRDTHETDKTWKTSLLEIQHLW